MRFYFPDINVWVALAYRGHQHHPAAASWFNNLQGSSVGFNRVTQMGFLRLLTHPMVMGDEVKTQRQAWKAYDALIHDSRIVFYTESDPETIEDDFRALTTLSRSSPQQWPDAYLAAFAKSGGLTLVTFDRGLSKLAGDDVLLLK